jgi:hypothetical protein
MVDEYTSNPEEDLIKLRRRLNEARSAGVFDTPAAGAGFAQQTLIQLVNEATRGEQGVNQEITRLQSQIDHMKGKAAAFRTMRTVVYAVVDALMVAGERAAKEAEDQAAEQKEKADFAAKEAAQASATTTETPKASSEEKPRKGSHAKGRNWNKQG